MDEMARRSIDDKTADRLLSGGIDPEDAPPGYEHVARMVRALQAPANPAELTREQAVASMAATVAAEAAPAGLSPNQQHRRKNKVISKLGAVRAAAITAAAVLGAGAAAAAATGSLPSQESKSSHSTGSTTSSSTAAATNSSGGNGSSSGNPNLNQSNPLNLPTTGAGNFHAVIGLCRAFLNHNTTSSTSSTTSPTTAATGTSGSGTSGGATPPPEDNSTAFQALVKDATGSITGSLTKTAAWCTTYLSKYSPGQSGTAPNHSTTPDNGSGKPTSPGNSGTHSNSVRGSSSTPTSTGSVAGGGAGSAGSGGTGRR